MAEQRQYGIEATWLLPEGNGVGVCCECRTRTEILIDTSGIADGERIDLPQQAFTCSGCGTVHWFTLGLTEPAP
jgi:hypothetical protein